jgi:hypothetical protein
MTLTMEMVGMEMMEQAREKLKLEQGGIHERPHPQFSNCSYV